MARYCAIRAARFTVASSKRLKTILPRLPKVGRRFWRATARKLA